jgi:hypothetical protein
MIGIIVIVIISIMIFLATCIGIVMLLDNILKKDLTNIVNILFSIILALGFTTLVVVWIGVIINLKLK